MMLRSIGATRTQSLVFGNKLWFFANIHNTPCHNTPAVICEACVLDNVSEHEGSGRRLKLEHVKPLLSVTEIPPITPSTTCFAHPALIKGLINIMHSFCCVEAPYLILSTSLKPISYSTLTSSWHQVGIRPVRGQNMAA